MADLLKISSDVIDGRVGTDEIGPLNRINFQLSEIADDVAMVEAFSHSILFKTDEGMVVFDTSSHKGAGRVIDAIRHWSTDPFHSLVYTHGHVDHVGGCGAFLQDAEDRGHRRPQIIGHENVKSRFDRYNYTNGYNLTINQRQFGSVRKRGYDIGSEEHFLPGETAAPDLTYRDKMDITIGGRDFSLIHAKGETDDHSWSWIRSHKAICAGDFLIWAFPNAGNPQKVQRYPAEWAAAMRAMAAKDAELFLPAHGLPIAGRNRIKSVLNDVADALEFLVRETVTRMNEGAKLDDIVHEVKLDRSVLEKPFMQPIYDEPEFVIRNIWRLYGGGADSVIILSVAVVGVVVWLTVTVAEVLVWLTVVVAGVVVVLTVSGEAFSVAAKRSFSLSNLGITSCGKDEEVKPTRASQPNIAECGELFVVPE